MAEQNIDICIAARQQVGAVTYKQRPAGGFMELYGLTNDDGYTSWTVTLPTTQVESYMATALAYGDRPLTNLKCAQVTATTMAGGMSSVEVRVQDLVQNPHHEQVTPPDPDPEEEPTAEEEAAAGEGSTNSKIINCDITFQEAPLPTHPYFADLAECSPAIRDAIGAVHKSANIYRPIPIDGSGNMRTPLEILGEVDCALLQSI